MLAAAMVCLLAGWSLLAEPQDKGDPGPPVAAATSGKSSPKADAAKKSPWALALKQVARGSYDAAATLLSDQVKAKPGDKRAAAGLKLLQVYQARHKRIDAERKTELGEAGKRVREIMIAQEYLAKLAEAKIEKKLRDKVQEVGSAYNDAANADALEEARTDKAGKDVQKQTVKAYDKSRSAMKNALKVLKGNDSTYAKTFRKAADAYLARLAEHRKLWSSVATKTTDTRRDSARKLRPLEYDLTSALGDVEAMISTKPWRVALMHARLAKQIAVESDHLGDLEWFRSLISDVQARAKRNVDEAKWFDALTAYVALQELQPDSAHFKRMVKTVRRHVRVLGLYGRKGELGADNGNGNKNPKNGGDEDDEPAWKQMVSGVDADMIEKAIRQLDGYYVRSVDYRQVTRGGLTSVKILAETPQASYSFPALSDKNKRKQFLEAIDRQLVNIKKRDRVDHLDLQLALNSILRASERSVQIPTEVLAVEFTDGFLDELDRFSSMIWPNDVDDFKKHTMGHFYGVGIQITKEPGEPLRVVTPLAGSPAFRAGIKTNDLIVAVDGKRTEPLSIDKLVRRITGKKGTKVMLKVKRIGKLKAFDVSIIRDEIHIRTVKGWHRKPGGEWDYVIDPKRRIGYIRITQFTDQTSKHLAEALGGLAKAGSLSLIVDLRYNPGGLLRAATRVANEFLGSGRIVSTRGLQTRQSEINAHATGKYLNGDVVLLVNQHSASAAEILAGAIKDRHRGLIVGHRTFGKGSVQNVIPIRPHRAFLKLTTAYYYLPLGRCLHRLDGAKTWGVEPDVAVPITPRQTKRWLDIRRKTDLLQDIDAGRLARDLERQFKADIQLNAAVLLLRMMQLDRPAEGEKQAA